MGVPTNIHSHKEIYVPEKCANRKLGTRERERSGKCVFVYVRERERERLFVRVWECERDRLLCTEKDKGAWIQCTKYGNKINL